MKKLYRKIKHFFDKYEIYLMPGTMAIGFIVDNFTLRRVDLWIVNLVIILYLILAIVCILYLNTYQKKLFQNNFLTWLNLITPYILQYAFGSLFSAFTVFYFRSSALVVSWPFLLILLGLLFGNEFFRKKYERLTFHLSILYLAIFAYTVFALPIIVKKIGPLIFLGSGLLSLLVISIIIYFVYKIDFSNTKKNKGKIIISIGLIYLLFNFLYFNNIIPPIPLAMKSGGVYHKVIKNNNGYELSFEKSPWYNFWRETSAIYHWQPGEKVYIFSSIFAPTQFNEQIYHRWLYYDEQKDKWIEKSKLGFSITGGRSQGYRGYSYKTNLQPGKWRVDVITSTNQVLGRIKFKIEQTQKKIPLISEGK